jgi:hypothetical protein
MSTHDDFELSVVSVSKSSSNTRPRKPISKLGRRSAPTPYQALAALRATKGAAAVIEGVPAVGDVSFWEESAYWSPCTMSGTAYDEPFMWGCDFIGGGWDLGAAKSNCIAYFAGHEDLGGMHKPNPLDGQIWCYQQTLTAGYYVFVAHVQTYPFYDDGYVATALFGINSQPLDCARFFRAIPSTCRFC